MTEKTPPEQPKEQVAPGIAPASESLVTVPTVIVAAGEDEVVGMLREQVRFADEPESRAIGIKLLEAGYTVPVTARKLGLRASTVWAWARDPEVEKAVKVGRARRRDALGVGLEEAAAMALRALQDVVIDDSVSPKDRIKASEVILDRCGITPESVGGGATVAVSIDVDFDERLARIVAGGKAGG